jgi:hypothetical protein
MQPVIRCTLFPNQTIFKVDETFSDIFPEYVRGKLGTDTITEASSVSLDLFNNIRSGILNLQEATLTCTIENGIGADGQLRLDGVSSLNSRTGDSVPLFAPSLVGTNINIDRATETGNSSDPVNETFKTITIDKTNSNLLDFIENPS